MAILLLLLLQPPQPPPTAPNRPPPPPTTSNRPQPPPTAPGTWQHDLEQAALLERHPNVRLKAYGADTHRLAAALARAGKLAPLLREAIAAEAGLPSKNVRLANVL
jgi:hypothetical protein